MTKLNTYRCDRCGKTWKISVDEVPAEVQKMGECRATVASQVENSKEGWQLCIDCSASFDFFINYKNYGKKLDEMIDRLIEEEEKIPT